MWEFDGTVGYKVICLTLEIISQTFIFKQRLLVYWYVSDSWMVSEALRQYVAFASLSLWKHRPFQQPVFQGMKELAWQWGGLGPGSSRPFHAQGINSWTAYPRAGM